MVMGRKCGDLSGLPPFGRLEVIRPAGKIGRNAASLCRCTCGTEKIVRNSSLLKGTTRSCGCLAKEVASVTAKRVKPRLKHGFRRTTTYNSWLSMVERCTNPECYNYPRYGGRGITICSRWSDPDKGMTNFVEDMGHRPSPAHSIDRIDSTKGYEPGNCRWATRSQQNQNVGLKNSNTSGYKGVSRVGHRWKAEIRCDGARYHLGCYSTKEEAALAYNIASEKLQGIYGVRNALPTMTRNVVRAVSSQVNLTLK